jgi:ABC-type uncharacterized transport system permease subunit
MKTRSVGWQIGLAVVPILISLAITGLLVLAVGSNPLDVFQTVWQGAFRDLRSLSGVMNFWIPLTLVGMGLVVTFTAGLWNIGAEGQMIMGGVFASWAALTLNLPSPLLIAVEIGLAMLGGALWALLVGLLKTRMGVNEIFGGVALNALAEVVAIYLISGPWQPPEGGSVRATPPFPADALLPPISKDFNVSLLAIILVVIVYIAVVLALRGTRWGLQLKATGKNARSALLLGVPTNRSAISALVVCGMVAGIAGGYRVLFTFGKLRPLSSGGIGFLALLVVLLLSMRGLWMPIVTFIFAAILSGSSKLQVALQLDSSLAGVLQETLVLVVLLFNGLRQRMAARTAAPSVVPEPTVMPRRHFLMNDPLINVLNSVVANATPLVIAAIGETITERAGVVNLSLDGSIILSAMLGFVAALVSGSALVGVIAAMIVGSVIALIVAASTIELRQDQVAIGFVLTLLAADLATFLGQKYTRIPGPQILSSPIAVLKDIPAVGEIFFNQSVLVYISYILVIGTWYWLFRTRPGLAHRAVGERPETAFARGANVNRLRYIYTGIGGALVGLAGATYSLSVKAGWVTPPNMQGDGWIALAIVIFGGWHPFRVVLGAYLFAGLRALSSVIQQTPGINIPVVLLNGVPWLLMIVTLLLVSSGAIERILMVLPRPVQKWTRNFLRSDPPAALGTRFEPD